MKKNILLVSENFPPRTGGSSRWFWEIYRRLPKSEVRIAAGEHPRQEEFDRTHDIQVDRMPLTLGNWGLFNLPSLLAYRRLVQRLRRIVKAERVAIVHCGRCLPEGLMGAWISRSTGIPFLCFVHGEDIMCATSSRELTWLTRRILNVAAFVIANSENTARILQEGWGLAEEKIRVLHPGVDTSWFVPAPRDQSVRTELGWGDRPVVLTVGRLQQRKGHDQMIRALQNIRRSVPGVLYAIVGDGEERRTLESLVESEMLQEHVQFLGEVDDHQMRLCYQQCDLFVLPNRQVGKDIEGFGIVLLEAQACGKPVVAGASGGTAETMKIGETGRIVSCEEPGEMAAVISDLLMSSIDSEKMGQAARQWVVNRFDWNFLHRHAERLFWADGNTTRIGVATVMDS